ncbi:uncharacterized protein METZ01_LOCUS330589, partial [marine metagenome]
RESMATVLEGWLENRSELLERARKARSLAMPDSLSKITEYCLTVAGVPS